MNVDEELKRVKPFMDEKRYTFTALFAHPYVRGTLQTKGIPRNWIVDRDGVFRVDEIGFKKPAERWLEEMSRNIEKVAQPD